MKKLVAGILTAALVLGMGTTGAFAAGHCGSSCRNKSGGGNCAQTVCAYVDADGDGYCDNCGVKAGTNKNCKNFVDENGDGLCDNCGKRVGSTKKCKHFVDENGDGICDNCDTEAHSHNCGKRGGGRCRGCR